MLLTSAYNYTFTKGGFKIILNAGDQQDVSNYTRSYVVPGAKLYVYVDDEKHDVHIYNDVPFNTNTDDSGISTLADDSNTQSDESEEASFVRYARAYDIRCYDTEFPDDNRRYVYAAIPREDSEERVALIVYPQTRIDIFGQEYTDSVSSDTEVEGEDSDEETVTEGTQIGNDNYYYIDLYGRISAASGGERTWEREIELGAVAGYIVSDDAAKTPVNSFGSLGGASNADIEALRDEILSLIDSTSFFEKYSLGEPYQETVIDPDTEEEIPATQQSKDDKGKLLYWTDESETDKTTLVTEWPVMEPVMNQNTAIRLKTEFLGLFTEGWLSAYGVNLEAGSGGGLSYDRLDRWDDYATEKSGWVLSAALGDDLYQRIKSLENKKYENEDITLTGDVTGTGKTLINTTISDGAVTNAKLQHSKMTLWGNEVSLGGSTNGAITIKNGDKAVTISVDNSGYLKVDGAMYATSFVSAYGKNDEAGGGGLSYDRLDRWPDYNTEKSGWVLSAALGNDLCQRITSLENKKHENEEITLSGDVTGKGKSAITATIANNAVTTVKMADNAVTTVKIADSAVTNAKLQHSKMTLWGNEVSLGGSTNGAITIKNGEKAVTISVDNSGYLKVDGALYATSFVSAYGKNDEAGGGGGASVSPSTWTSQAAFTSSLALASNLGWDLYSRVTALEGAVKPTYDWSEITGKPTFSAVATSGKYSDLSGTPTIPTTLPASDVYAWAKSENKPSYTTSEVSEGTNLYFTDARAQSAISTWAGTKNITTLGTITSGIWHGSKIANDYIENPKMTLWGNEVALGGSTNGAITIKNGEKSVTISVDDSGYLKVDGGMYATSFVSAFGLNAGGASGAGASVSPSTWTSQAAFTSSLALASNLGWDLHSRVTALEGAVKPTYDWSEITGKPTTLPASDVYAWAKESTKPSYTTSEVSEGTNLYFTDARAQSALSGHTGDTSNPHSVTKSQVGLGNVENTALSTWVGSSNITSLGTIISGSWQGNPIANSYLSNSSMTIAGSAVSLGGSISAKTISAAIAGTAKTAWGNTFWKADGTIQSISGDMTEVSKICNNDEYDSIVISEDDGYVGINCSPEYWLDVAGHARMQNRLYIGTLGNYIEVDENGYFHFSTGLYSSGFISAFGLNENAKFKEADFEKVNIGLATLYSVTEGEDEDLENTLMISTDVIKADGQLFVTKTMSASQSISTNGTMYCANMKVGKYTITPEIAQKLINYANNNL